MPRRVMNLPLPDVATVDLRADADRKVQRGAISRQLLAAMKVALDDDGQIILLLNRRGYSTHIQCPSCGEVVNCPHCDIALTHHRQHEMAICHYCEYQILAPSVCSECGAGGIRYYGLGTQKLEAEIRARFPNVPCLRMDTDSMRQAGSHERALDSFRSGEIKILLGTQMIAKGLDFPNVTLVGVINADTALHLPDFRAGERTFHLVTQVAGRTGRGKKGGRVLVQTLEPEHPAIQAAVRHDFVRFAQQELPTRKEHGYPPFASMIRLVIRGPKQNETRGFAEHLATLIRTQCEKHEARAKVRGPAPAPIPKLRGNYRFQIQTQSFRPEQLREAVRVATTGLKPPEEVQWMADVDPLDML
jgi:primosomal protein N' (replication factor Y)